MHWVLFLIIAYFFIALTALADKFLISKSLPSVVYAFFISTLGLAAILLAPFGLYWPGWWQIGLTAVAGIAYTLAVFFLYEALHYSEASRVFAISGSLASIITLFLSWLFLSSELGLNEIIGFIFLLAASVLISFEFTGVKVDKRGLWLAALTAVAFGISYTATKEIYTDQGFISGFIWIRIFAFIGILFFLLTATNRRRLKIALSEQSPMASWFNRVILFAGQAAAGVGFLLLNYAISLTAPALVLAGQGLQYVFLFLAAGFLSHYFPKIFKESLSRQAMIQKSLAVVLIGIGLVVLAL